MSKRALIFAAIAAAACGSVDDRGDCAASTDCPAGEYCAGTPDGNVCWPDATGPSLTLGSAACTGGCKRDGALVVDVTAADAESGILSAVATLTVGAAAHTVPLAPQGGNAFRGQLDLATIPFPHFSADATVSVEVQNGSRLPSQGTFPGAVGITRLKWTYTMDALALTAAAVMSDGTAVVGRAATTDQVLAVRADGTKAWSLTVGAGQPVSVPPSVGQDATWVAGEDGSLYGIALDGSAVVDGKGCSIGGTLSGPPTLRASGVTDMAFVGASDGTVRGTTATPNACSPTTVTDPFAASPALDATGALFAATSTGKLYRYTYTGSAFAEVWAEPSTVGALMTAAPSIDGQGNAWTGSGDGKLNVTQPTGVTVPSGTPGLMGEPAIIIAGGDVVVGDTTGKLHRVSPTGLAQWPSPPSLGAAVLTPIALANGDASFVVSTKGGKVYAIAADGQIVWSATLPSPELRTGNIYTPPGSTLSTAYFPAKDGKLHAVIVDGHLDTSAPWPKAWHDPRNTSNAATPF